MAIEYKTVVVDGAYHEYTSPSLRNTQICKDVDSEIEKRRARGWHLRSIWTVKGSIFLTMWKEY